MTRVFCDKCKKEIPLKGTQQSDLHVSVFFTDNSSADEQTETSGNLCPKCLKEFQKDIALFFGD